MGWRSSRQKSAPAAKYATCASYVNRQHAEVGPWAVEMIKKASPFPAPPAAMGSVKYTEIWLVDNTGRFQLDSLTEGQK